MRRLVARITRFYGAHPLHLLALLGCFALAGYVLLRLVDNPSLPAMGIWFAGAVVAHDLVLFPLYALADRSLSRALRVLRPGGATREPRVPALNYIRVPVLGAALTFLLFFPGILRHGAADFRAATGMTQDPYLERWLLLCAAMFLVSALVYAVRRAKA